MLRSGNFADSAYSGNGYVGLDALETAFEEGGPNNVVVNRLWYQFPIGSSFTATVGGRVRQDDMLAVWPSAYPADTVLDFFTYAGAPGTYNLTLGSGAGLSWESDDFSISANYVSANGSFSSPGSGTTIGTDPCGDTSGGIATDCAASNGTVQVAYAPENWGIAAAYNYASSDNGAGLYPGNGTPAANSFQSFGVTNSFGLSAWWSPEEAGWFPSISTGWGYNDTNAKNTPFINGSSSQSWYVGLQWADAFLKGNTFGMAVGQPTFVTSVDFKSDYPDSESKFVGDGNYAWEWWYQFQVTDNISVTPAIYYLSRPLGQGTPGLDADGVPNSDRSDTFSNFGGLLKTTFKF
jgi:hypothetical protein